MINAKVKNWARDKIAFDTRTIVEGAVRERQMHRGKARAVRKSRPGFKMRLSGDAGTMGWNQKHPSSKNNHVTWRGMPEGAIQQVGRDSFDPEIIYTPIMCATSFNLTAPSTTLRLFYFQDKHELRNGIGRDLGGLVHYSMSLTQSLKPNNSRLFLKHFMKPPVHTKEAKLTKNNLCITIRDPWYRRPASNLIEL
jgi:hypothetical protein